MTIPVPSVVRLGLAQIPTDGLKRLIRWIDAGKPLCLTGAIRRGNGDP